MVEVFDPHGGDIRGHRELRKFVRSSQGMLAKRHVTIETESEMSIAGRAVVEYLADLDQDGATDLMAGGRRRRIPRRSVGRVPHVLQPVAGGGRPADPPPILRADHVHPGDVVGRYQAALDAGDLDGIVSTFAADGYVHEPTGSVHRGIDELRSFFAACFSAGGGIGLELCQVTDDEVRCAVEYNCVRWGDHDLPPQAGLMVFERGADGLLAAARIYDDVEPPDDRP